MDKIKAVLSLIIITLLILVLPSCSAKAKSTTTTELATEVYQQNVEVKKTSAEIREELGIPMQKVNTNSKNKLIKLMDKCKKKKDKLKKSYPD